MNKSLMMIIPLILAGCQTLEIHTDVDAISAMPAEIEDRTIFIVPYEGQDDESIAWSSNTNILSSELQKKGFTTVNSSDKAAFIAYFGYAINKGEAITTNYSIPRYGVVGYTGSSTSGSVYGNTYSSNTTLNPRYGVTGYVSRSRTDVIFTRSIRFEMFDKKTKEPVFDASAISRGDCHSFHPIAPYIISSTLIEFPNGKIGTVVLDTLDGYDC